jgi:alpha-D-ribose 1-methylphosphonate 5-triphosphate synthase subunit PhnG
MHMTENTEITAARAGWLKVLAQADASELARLAAPVLADYRFELLRPPEPALVMVRSRIGNTGDRFNLGEATLTRCAVRHQGADGSLVAGVGYVMGLDEDHAEAVANALLQRPALQALLMRTVVQPLRERLEARRLQERERTEASRVRFFTLQPEVA